MVTEGCDQFNRLRFAENQGRVGYGVSDTIARVNTSDLAHSLTRHGNIASKRKDNIVSHFVAVQPRLILKVQHNSPGRHKTRVFGNTLTEDSVMAMRTKTPVPGDTALGPEVCCVVPSVGWKVRNDLAAGNQGFKIGGDALLVQLAIGRKQVLNTVLGTQHCRYMSTGSPGFRANLSEWAGQRGMRSNFQEHILWLIA